MPKLELTIKIIISDYKAQEKTDVVVKTMAMRDQMPEAIDMSKMEVVAENTNTFKNMPLGVGLEHYLAAAADQINAALKLHGNEFGS